MDGTTRSRLIAAGTVSVAGLLLLGACGGSGGGGTAGSTSVVDSTAFRTIPVTAPPTTAPPPSTAAGGGGTGSSGADSGGSTQQPSGGGTQGNTYTVEAGDYFYGIASKLGVDPNALAAYNDMTLQSNLVPGMTLRVPPSGTSSGSGSSGSSDTTASSGSGGSNTTQPSGNFYLVVDNDYWAGIAKKLGVTVEALLAANNATSSTVIHPGQRLKVPG